MRLFGVILGEGNIKVGEVMNFSLPSIMTCPGASDWCKRYCYAKRMERLKPNCRQSYRNNLHLVQNPDQFTKIMIGVLPRILPCFRIHVSGDIFSKDYAETWKKICQAFPQTNFWSYTRSWSVPSLLPALEELRDESNMNLLASTDPGMPLPPPGWRTAFIEGDPRATGMLCSHQEAKADSCLACGYCFRQKSGNVIFRIH